jgi:uncharacterized protein YggU (UPF0235/DUF167 family)
MRIIVKVKPSAKKQSVERMTQATLDLGLKEGETVYRVSVKEDPVGGKANEAVVKALAEYFEVSKSQVNLVRGGSVKNKVFEILK